MIKDLIIHKGWLGQGAPADGITKSARRLLMFETTINTTEVEPLPIGFIGVSVKLLHRGGRDGMVVLTRLAPGAVIPEHWHSEADETVYVLDGDFVEGGFSYGPGTFFFGKAGRPHGPHTSLRGCTALMQFSTTGDLDFNAVDIDVEAIG
jgi:quercetin dioxygenase-like cupin family protein